MTRVAVDAPTTARVEFPRFGFTTSRKGQRCGDFKVDGNVFCNVRRRKTGANKKKNKKQTNKQNSFAKQKRTKLTISHGLTPFSTKKTNKQTNKKKKKKTNKPKTKKKKIIIK
jgi:hypothetical protein